MKYFFYSLIIIVAILGLCYKGEMKTTNISDYDLLRIHIRANSNSQKDQNIKYEIKDLVLDNISEDISKLTDKSQVEEYFTKNADKIQNFIDTFLKNNGFDYKSKVRLKNEYFPVRVYGNYMVNSGFYDAVIIELGNATGENWWCVAYPPLCFADYSEEIGNVVYKSRFLEIIKQIIK